MNRITTKFLQQQYDIVAEQYNIQVKELPVKEFGLSDGMGSNQILMRSLMTGCLGCAPPLGDFYKVFCQKHTITGTCILINGQYANFRKIATLFHEEGHIRCRLSGCFCFQGNDAKKPRKRSYQELHACRYALQSLIDREMWKSLHYYIDVGVSYFSPTSFEDVGKVYQNSAKMVKRSKIWKEAKRLDEEKRFKK